MWNIAHRGASWDRPENTLAAFDEALAQGAEGLELDVQLTRDDVLVVYHDRWLRKVGGGLGTVGSSSLEELRRLDAGRWFAADYAGERIPTLDDVLERYASRLQLLLEIKIRGRHERLRLAARQLAQAVGERGLEERTWILCFDEALLREVTAELPRARTVLNLDPPPRLDSSVARRLDGLAALSVDVRRLATPFADAVRRRELPLFTYTCNSVWAVERSLGAGAVAVMSDRPAWLGILLRETRARR